MWRRYGPNGPKKSEIGSFPGTIATVGVVLILTVTQLCVSRLMMANGEQGWPVSTRTAQGSAW